MDMFDVLCTCRLETLSGLCRFANGHNEFAKRLLHDNLHVKYFYDKFVRQQFIFECEFEMIR